MVRVLHVITGMGSGGAESYIMNMYRNIDNTKVQFDFLLRSTEVIYEDEIKKMGGRIFYTAEFPRHIFKNRRETREFLKNHKYDIIHIHGNALIYMTALKYAKKFGIKCRIMHSHNIDTKVPVYRIVHKWNKLFIKNWATDYFACSTAAGEWMFNSDFILKNNAVDTTKFSPDDRIKADIRQELGIEDKFVIGHIGRFIGAKNHPFLIKIFNEYHKKNPDSVLLLIGSGSLEDSVRNLVKDYKLENAVKFLGVRNDMYRVLQSFDVMLFPSIHEGLPVSIVEAQAAGVPCIISSNITKEVVLSPLVKQVNLEDSIDKWIDTVDSFKNAEIDQNVVTEGLIKAGFDSKTAAQELQSFYLSQAEK